MIHKIFPVGLLQCNCSVLGDEDSGEAIVVDPGDEVEKVTAILDEYKLRVTAIVITHGHIDHVMGAEKLRALTQAPVYMNQADTMLLDMLQVQAGWLGIDEPARPEIDSNANDGLTLTLGKTPLHVMHTPGHTPGSCCVWLPEHSKLIAGDTLFRDSVGRTDLPGGNSRQLLSSIKTRLLPLPDETVVVPGHGASTTLGRERQHNPFLRNL
jgi:hydroxyacylglutathione hydrolase